MRVGYHPKLVNDYLKALKIELERFDFSTIDTVYFGGGTPSVLSIDELKELFALVQSILLQAEEVTFEINPETLTFEKAQLLSQVGINRVSLGVQSFNAKEITDMDRFHTPKMIDESLYLLRSVGIDNISIDLMYGLPHQTLESLNNSLDKAFSLLIPHISIYALTLEENSLWGRQNRQPIDAQLEEAMYELICKKCDDEGYSHYEISNFTKGRPSKHNLHYWNYDDYVGCGPKAASKVGNIRTENTSNFLKYAQAEFVHDQIELSPLESAFERIMMGLRLKTGINILEFNQKTGLDFLEHYSSAIQKHRHLKHLELNQTHIRCTEEGRALLHDVLVDFMLD